MRFPEEYIKRGEFKLHSGDVTHIFYDANALITDAKYLGMILSSVPDDCESYVGVATGGAIIASHFKSWAMIKDGELKGSVRGDYCLIDDVCTTEGSLREAIEIIGRSPKHIFVVG